MQTQETCLGPESSGVSVNMVQSDMGLFQILNSETFSWCCDSHWVLVNET